jgi:hypothetical protein
MRVYISGQISGLPIEKAKRLFEKAETALWAQGYTPINPMKETKYDERWEWEDYMKADIKLLMDCEGICMLPNWRLSRGAIVEHNLGCTLGLKVIYSNVKTEL